MDGDVDGSPTVRALVFLAIAILVSGCISARGPVGETTCQHGATGIFMKVRLYGGFTPREYSVQDYFLDRGSELYYFRGGYEGESGTGKVETSGARLHFLKPEEVKPELQRAGFYQPAKDFNLSVAWKVPVDAADFRLLCDKANAEFYKLGSEYNDPRIADCGWTEINANTLRGDKTVRSWCDAAPDAFDEYKEAFFNVAERARMSANIPE
jgi:hypothetical protein